MKIERGVKVGRALIFAVLFATLALTSVGCASAAQTHYVNPGESIQRAIGNAIAGDTIIVRDGTYTENVDVNVNHLTLKSEHGADSTIVQAASTSKDVFAVTADYVNISGFTVKNATRSYKAGIYLGSRADHCNISYNNASNNYLGIRLSSSSHNMLVNNIANSNNYSGICLLASSNNNNIAGNTATNNYVGIYLIYSSDNTLTNNTANSNNYVGIYLIYSSDNTLTNNTANSNNNDGIDLSRSSDNTLTNNTANSNNNNGIDLSFSNGNTLTNNTANSNKYGIYLFSSGRNVLTNNAFVNDGLFVSNSYNNIVKNNIVNGKPLVYLEAASDYVIANAGQVIGQVILVNCENITVENLELSNISVGLELVGTKNSKIMNNTANTNSYGIYLLSSSNNTLSNNIFVNDGLFVDYSYKNTVENNTVNSKPLVYLEEALDYKVEDAGQVILVNCENITVENLELSNTSVGVTLLGTNNSKIMNNTANSNNDDGIRLSSSSGNRLTGNTANFNSGASIWLSRSSNNNNLTENTVNSNNEYGIYLLWSNNNTLTKNTANANNEYGIYLFSSDNNNLTENTVNSNKKYGIYLSDFSDNNNLTKNTANANKKYGIYLIFSSNNNIIYNNYFNNTNNARDKGNNIWSITKTEGINIIGGPYLGGNYWSDYTGKDSDGDGLGNTLLPYDSSGDIKNGGDYLPLVKPSASALCDTGAGTYPQQEYKNTTGEAITCSTFNHANGETYTDRMPATRLV